MLNFTTYDRPFHHLFEKICCQYESDTPTNNFAFTTNKKNYLFSLLFKKKKHNKIKEKNTEKSEPSLPKKKRDAQNYLNICDIFEMIYPFRVFSNRFTKLSYHGSKLRSSSSNSRSYKTQNTRLIKTQNQSKTTN
jgi:hypothetical protein